MPNGLDLDLSQPRTRGRAAKPCTVMAERDLTETDMAALEIEQGVQVYEPIAKLRERHHTCARLMAQGASGAQITAVTGYSPPTLSRLRKDPTFIELLAHYAEQVDDAVADTHARLSGLSLQAISELQDRLDDEPEDISTPQLLDILKVSADRSGHGPEHKSTQNLNVNIGLAERLAAATQRAQNRIIDITPTSVARGAVDD